MVSCAQMLNVFWALNAGAMKLDQAKNIRKGEELNWEKLEAYLRQELPALTQGTMEVAQFHGGHANLTYLIKFGDQEMVLRRPPFGKIAPGAHDMQREYRILSRLHDHFAPAPRAHLLCTDSEIIGADFILMQRRNGVVVRYKLPACFVGMADVENRLSDALMKVCADLHLVDVEAAGLTELGRPEGFIDRQLRGWAKRWALSKTEENADMDRTMERLLEDVPAPQRVSIVHGDLKFDNCQFQPDDPDEVTSVFDWDMATLGDPLVDLAGLLSFWPDPELDPRRVPVLLAGDFPDKAYLKERYAAYSGLDLSRMDWYESFACYKTAVIAQQLYRRFADGATQDQRMAGFGETAKAMAALALSKLGG
jgi:aminoglycoside phosphotransferase (APT) family kinase protein